MKKVLNSNSMKIIAIIAMVLDHIALAFIPLTNFLYYIFRVVGRVTAPIMFYSLANGFHYTKNKFRYGCRLLLFAIISQIPYSLFIHDTFFQYNDYNVLFTLLLGLLALYALYDVNNYIIKILLFVGSCFLSLFCEFGIFGIILILLFYIFKYSKFKILYYSFVCLLYLIIKTFIENSLIIFVIFSGLFLCIPLFMADNCKKGKLNLKYLFYAFYPFHLIVLYLIEKIF